MRLRIWTFAAVAAVAIGCGGRSPVGGSVSPVVYFEIPVSDLDRAARFYESVFGVRLERKSVDGYDMAAFPAGGALVKGDVYVPSKSGPILYFDTPSIDRTLARALSAGGTVLYAKKDIGDPGWVAEFEDSEGNRIALSESRRR